VRSRASPTATARCSTFKLIHAINGAPVVRLDDLVSVLDGLEPRSSVVLQIERDGRLTFVAFQLD
jgi:S1-C subfamily serine protease